MLKFKALDSLFPIETQLDADIDAVVLLNVFTVERQDIALLEEAWRRDAKWMQQQPGFISTQLHKAVGESCVFMNYAEWKSVAHFREAFTHPDFRSALNCYPDSAVASPHLFKKQDFLGIYV